MKVRGGFKNWSLIALALLVVFGFAACGGGGGSSGGGTGSTGMSIGVITAFGSIYVNGVEFDTDSAMIYIDDSPGDKDDLELGMVVVVKGEYDDDGTTGIAMTVSFDDVVEGPVTSAVNTTTRSFTVMGQVVFYTGATVFEISDGGVLMPTDLAIGNVVEVSGLFDSAWQVQATRVERESVTFTPGDELEVKGMVANLDTLAQTFTIGALDINYIGNTTIFDDGNISDLANSVFVEVKGSNDVVGDGFLNADEIEFEFDDFGDDGDLLEFEGFVTSIPSLNGDFDVNGMPVVTDSQTKWEGGYTGLADVMLDHEVEVEGTIQDQGGTLVLLAREVELDIEDDVKIEALLEAIDNSANTLTILGIGVAYSDTTAKTEFEDEDGSTASVDDLTVNDWIKVEAVQDSVGDLFAVEVHKDNDEEDLSRIILQGPAANIPVSPPGPFTILGVDIALGEGVQYRVEDTPITQTIFFNNLTEGRIIKARGSFSGGTLTASRLELED